MTDHTTIAKINRVTAERDTAYRRIDELCSVIGGIARALDVGDPGLVDVVTFVARAKEKITATHTEHFERLSKLANAAGFMRAEQDGGINLDGLLRHLEGLRHVHSTFALTRARVAERLGIDGGSSWGAIETEAAALKARADNDAAKVAIFAKDHAHVVATVEMRDLFKAAAEKRVALDAEVARLTEELRILKGESLLEKASLEGRLSMAGDVTVDLATALKKALPALQDAPTIEASLRGLAILVGVNIDAIVPPKDVENPGKLPDTATWAHVDGIWHSIDKDTPDPAGHRYLTTRCGSDFQKARIHARSPDGADAICVRCFIATPDDQPKPFTMPRGPWVLRSAHTRDVGTWHRIDLKSLGESSSCGFVGRTLARAPMLPADQTYAVCRVCNGLPRHDFRAKPGFVRKHLWIDGDHRVCESDDTRAAIDIDGVTTCSSCIAYARKAFRELGGARFEADFPEELRRLSYRAPSNLSEPQTTAQTLDKAIAVARAEMKEVLGASSLARDIVRALDEAGFAVRAVKP